MTGIQYHGDNYETMFEAAAVPVTLSAVKQLTLSVISYHVN